MTPGDVPITTVCDRCDVPIDDEGCARLLSVRRPVKESQPRSRIDLCDDCFLALRAWLKNEGAERC